MYQTVAQKNRFRTGTHRSQVGKMFEIEKTGKVENHQGFDFRVLNSDDIN